MKNFFSSNLSLVLDKLFDAIFIFLGVFFAFFFNKCQQDKHYVSELNYNLSQIMRDLPDEEPSSSVKPVNLKQTMKGGDCGLYLDGGFNLEPYSGVKNLNVILNRGLGGYLKEKNNDVLALISAYYDTLVKKHITSREVFYDKFVEVQSRGTLQDECFSESKVQEFELELAPAYMNYKRDMTLAKFLGFHVYKRLKKMGLEKQKIESVTFDFKFTIEDDEESK